MTYLKFHFRSPRWQWVNGMVGQVLLKQSSHVVKTAQNILWLSKNLFFLSKSLITMVLVQYEGRHSRYMYSHYKGKTLVSLCYLHNGISYSDMIAYLYWERSQYHICFTAWLSCEVNTGVIIIHIVLLNYFALWTETYLLPVFLNEFLRWMYWITLFDEQKRTSYGMHLNEFLRWIYWNESRICCAFSKLKDDLVLQVTFCPLFPSMDISIGTHYS